MAEQSVQSLRDAVDAAIASSGDAVVAKVTSHYVDAEIERRSKLLVAGVDAIRQAEVDLKKISRPNIIHYNEDGTVAASHYDKATLASIKKGKERLDKLTNSLNTVLAKHDAESFKKLDEAIKKGGKSGGKDTEDSDENGDE